MRAGLLRTAVVGGALAAAAGLAWIGTAEGAAAPEVVSFEEGLEPGSFARTVRLAGRSLTKVKEATLAGPAPATTARVSTILFTGKESLVLGLPAGLPQGDYALGLLDAKGVQVASAVLRLNLGSPAPGTLDADTLGGLAPGAFLRTTGGTLTGPLTIADGSGNPRAVLGADILRFLDAAGKARLEEGLSPAGDPYLQVRDAAEYVRGLLLYYGAFDSASLSLLDAAGAFRAALSESAGASNLVFYDSAVSPVVRMQGSDAGGFLTVSDSGGSTTYGP